MENLGRNSVNELMALENVSYFLKAAATSAESHTVFLRHISTFAFLVANEEFRAEDYRSFKQSQEGLLGDRLFGKQGSKTFAEDQQNNQDAKLLVPSEKKQLKLGGLSSSSSSSPGWLRRVLYTQPPALSSPATTCRVPWDAALPITNCVTPNQRLLLVLHSSRLGSWGRFVSVSAALDNLHNVGFLQNSIPAEPRNILGIALGLEADFCLQKGSRGPRPRRLLLLLLLEFHSASRAFWDLLSRAALKHPSKLSSSPVVTVRNTEACCFV